MTNLKLDNREANQYSPLALAFLGDAVYEQRVRERIVLSANMPSGKLHNLTIKRVCAEYQAKAVERIADELTEEEQSVLRRGRNATGMAVPRHSSVAEYRSATGLESLFGWLHLKGEQARIDELFDKIWEVEP